MFFSLSLQGKPGTSLVFSLPQTNEYQAITNLRMEPEEEVSVVEDKSATNKILVGSTDISLMFDAVLKKRNETISKNLSLSDYTTQQKKALVHDEYINGEDSEIQNIAKELFKDEKNLRHIIRKAYDYTLNYLTYGNAIQDLYPFSDALSKKVVDCGGFSTFLGSLLQVKGIPTRLIVGYVLKKNNKKQLLSRLVSQTYTFADLSMHAWLEALLPDNSWFPLDASTEWRRIHGQSRRKGGFGETRADRLVVSYGHNLAFSYIDKPYSRVILQDPAYLTV